MIMKAQLIPFVFLVLLVAGVLLGYIFYNVFYGTKYEESVFERSVIDVLRNEVERFEGYLKQSLIYSSHQSLREHACLGGLVGNMSPWISNGPNPLKPEKSIECLEKYTSYYTNVYLSNYSILNLPVTLTKKNFSSCIYDVDPNEVLTPKGSYDPYYDEGNFWVNISEAVASVSGGNAVISNDINLNTYITRNRYWYMFRIFTEWSEYEGNKNNPDSYVSCICSCAASCKDCNCAEKCAEDALEQLQERFNETDDYVICNMSKECCAEEYGDISCNQTPCYSWTGTRDCHPTPTSRQCVDPSTGADSYPVSSGFASTTQEEDYGEGFYNYLKNLNLNPFSIVLADSTNCSNCSCTVWKGHKLGVKYEYRCDDHKYYIPSDKGPAPLEFVVNAEAFWDVPGACKEYRPCSGSYDENCTECSCPPCPGNPCS